MIVAAGALAGTTAAVSGASSGIGLATARRLHALGASVTGARARGATLIPGARAGRSALDVTRCRTPRAPRSRASSGSTCSSPPRGRTSRAARSTSSTRAGWDAVVGTNLSGVFHLVAAALPALRAARGLVIVVGSVSGAWPDRSGPAYQAAKAGALAFARGAGARGARARLGRALQRRRAGDGRLAAARPAARSRRRPSVRARMLRPEDVAELIAVLAALPPEVRGAGAHRAAVRAAGARPRVAIGTTGERTAHGRRPDRRDRDRPPARRARSAPWRSASCPPRRRSSGSSVPGSSSSASASPPASTCSSRTSPRRSAWSSCGRRSSGC